MFACLLVWLSVRRIDPAPSWTDTVHAYVWGLAWHEVLTGLRALEADFAPASRPGDSLDTDFLAPSKTAQVSHYTSQTIAQGESASEV